LGHPVCLLPYSKVKLFRIWNDSRPAWIFGALVIGEVSLNIFGQIPAGFF
jgi:hypothetical protein